MPKHIWLLQDSCSRAVPYKVVGLNLYGNIIDSVWKLSATHPHTLQPPKSLPTEIAAWFCLTASQTIAKCIRVSFSARYKLHITITYKHNVPDCALYASNDSGLLTHFEHLPQMVKSDLKCAIQAAQQLTTSTNTMHGIACATMHKCTCTTPQISPSKAISKTMYLKHWWLVRFSFSFVRCSSASKAFFSEFDASNVAMFQHSKHVSV